MGVARLLLAASYRVRPGKGRLAGVPAQAPSGRRKARSAPSGACRTWSCTSLSQPRFGASRRRPGARRRASSASSTSRSSRRSLTESRTRSPVSTSAERPAGGGFGRDVQHDGAEGGAGHAAVAHPHHVLHALAAELLRDRQVAGFRHAGRGQRPGILQHQDVVGLDVEVVVVDPLGEVLPARRTPCSGPRSRTAPGWRRCASGWRRRGARLPNSETMPPTGRDRRRCGRGYRCGRRRACPHRSARASVRP